MFNPIALSLGADKGTAMRTSKRVFLDEGRDYSSRANALEFLAYNLVKALPKGNKPWELVDELGNVYADMHSGYVSDLLERLIRRV